MLVFTARHVLPVASPPIESGAVAVEDGRIVAVGSRRDVLRSIGGAATTRDLGDVALVPGLVNAHTHLELSWCSVHRPQGSGFAGWIRSLVTTRAGIAPEEARAAAESALRYVVARGTAAVGDLSNEEWIAPIVARSSLSGVLFHELFGFRAAEAERILEDAAERLDRVAADADVRSAGARLMLALTPHALYSTSPVLLRALAGRAAASREPLSIHVAESEAESELLLHGTGPLALLLRERGAWDDTWRPPGLSPVEVLDRLGLLSSRTLAVHCVHLRGHDLALLAARGVTVVTCPRSNAQLGVGRAPVPAMLDAGIAIALGTDSLASAPDLDLFAEMAALRAEHPGLAPGAVLRMATHAGARALGIEHALGSLEPGKRAALVAVALDDPHEDPLEAVTSCPRAVAFV